MFILSLYSSSTLISFTLDGHQNLRPTHKSAKTSLICKSPTSSNIRHSRESSPVRKSSSSSVLGRGRLLSQVKVTSSNTIAEFNLAVRIHDQQLFDDISQSVKASEMAFNPNIKEMLDFLVLQLDSNTRLTPQQKQQIIEWKEMVPIVRDAKSDQAEYILKRNMAAFVGQLMGGQSHSRHILNSMDSMVKGLPLPPAPNQSSSSNRAAYRHNKRGGKKK